MLERIFLFFVFSVHMTHGQSRQPHILFIITDDQGYYDIGYHGAEIRTPVIDDLAANGVKLENYYVQPICTPSRSQLLSGRYQIHTGMQHGVLGSRSLGGLPLYLPTLPEKLKDVGYATHMVGKWHQGYHMEEYTPTFRGFDTFYGLYNGAFDHYDHTAGGNGYDLHFNEGEVQSVAWNDTDYSTYTFANRAIEVINMHNADEPLFLYLPFPAPHTPLQAPAECLVGYEDIENDNRRIYAGMVTCIDNAIGNVTEALKSKGMWDSTIVIFTSDNGGNPTNGGASNYPLRGTKGGYFEGGVRVIGFVSGPLVPNPGVINTELMHISDWYPTLVTLAGGTLEPELNLDGYDQWDAIISGTPSPRTEILHNINPRAGLIGENLFPDIFDVRVQSAIRVGNFKLLTGNPGNDNHYPQPDEISDRTRQKRQADDKNIWLFNIAEDPNEHVDLSDVEPGMVIQLLERLAFYNSTAVEVCVPETDSSHSADDTGGAWVPWMEEDTGCSAAYYK